MATLKYLILPHHRKDDGSYNIKVRITHNRKVRYIATPWYASKEDITRTLKIKNRKLIDLCEDLIRDYRKRLDQLGESISGIDVARLADLLASSDDSRGWRLDLMQYGKTLVSDLSASDRLNTAKIYKKAINSLVAYVGRDKIDINEITSALIRGWIKWLMDAGTPSAASIYPAYIKALYNRAKRDYNDEDIGIIRIPRSPFSRVDIPRQPVANKRSLSIEQLRHLASVRCDTKVSILAKDMFFLSFFLVGINAIDLWSCPDIKDGVLTYCRHKTAARRDDKALISITVPPEAMPIIDKYRDKTGERLLDMHTKRPNYNAFYIRLWTGIKRLRRLSGIHDLDFYSARHSWATIAINDVGIDKYTVHEALNHADQSMRITDVYIRKSFRHIDEANRKVLDYANIVLSQ